MMTMLTFLHVYTLEIEFLQILRQIFLGSDIVEGNFVVLAVE
jgi:hypothetical protein